MGERAFGVREAGRQFRGYGFPGRVWTQLKFE